MRARSEPQLNDFLFGRTLYGGISNGHIMGAGGSLLCLHAVSYLL